MYFEMIPPGLALAIVFVAAVVGFMIDLCIDTQERKEEARDGFVAIPDEHENIEDARG